MREDEFRPRIWPWLRRVIVDWAIIVGCFALIAQQLSWLVSTMCFVVIAARQHALGILGHDGAHRLVCRSRLLNDFLTGLLCFWPLGFAIEGYRRFHFKHHRDVGTAEDPELIHKNNSWIGQWSLPLHRWKLGLQLLTDLMGGAIPHLGFAAYLTRPTSIKDQLGPAITLSSFVAISWWCECLWIPIVWFGSIWTVFWCIFRIRIWSEHVGTSSTHVLRASPLERFFLLPHNTWCHAEHHDHPAVPCWALPDKRPPDAMPLTLRQLFQRFAVDQEHDDTPRPDGEPPSRRSPVVTFEQTAPAEGNALSGGPPI